MSGSFSSLPLIELALLAGLCPEPSAAPPERGVALGLFASDATWDYAELVDEIIETGATHLSVVWVWWQHDVESTRIAPRPARSATDAQIVRTIAHAEAAGLHVTAFPIVRLLSGTRTDWRGKIAPRDEDMWWDSYRAFILHGALLAKAGGADRYSVGSELLSREHQRDRWVDLIERVRLRAGELEIMYSANWDHYRPVSFWDAVDVIGVTGYWELTDDLDASVNALTEAWGGPRAELRRWAAALDRPFVLTEVGYPSLDGGAAWPWDETREAPVDLEEQARAYRAFAAAWSGVDALRGVYFWNWFGFGGPDDGDYTPRGKPAAEVIRSWYAASESRDDDICSPSRLRP
jgi:hypothetical protein